MSKKQESNRYLNHIESNKYANHGILKGAYTLLQRGAVGGAQRSQLAAKHMLSVSSSDAWPGGATASAR